MSDESTPSPLLVFTDCIAIISELAPCDRKMVVEGLGRMTDYSLKDLLKSEPRPMADLLERLEKAERRLANAKERAAESEKRAVHAEAALEEVLSECEGDDDE